MKGIELAQVRDAIVSAFNADEFDMFLYERFDFDRPVFIADGPFKKVVFDVLRSFEQQGTDPLLIAEVARERPMRADVQQVYRKYAMALVDQARRDTIDQSVTTALDRYRLGPTIMVQKGGMPQLPAAVPGNETGLERNVRPYLPFIDVGRWRGQLFQREGQVCRVEVGNEALGTGFLVGPDTLLTNYHVLRGVIDHPEQASGVKFRFDYQVLDNGTKSDGTLVSLASADWLVDFTPLTPGEDGGPPDGRDPTVDELDFALVRLEGAFGNEPRNPNDKGSAPRGWIAVPSAAPLISSNPPMPILILEHPNTEPLKLAVDTSAVLSVLPNGTRIRYTTNTEPGSSGSPCFDIGWTLLALHHYGDPLHDRAQYNQGVPIEAIRQRLQRVGKSAALGGASPPPGA